MEPGERLRGGAGGVRLGILGREQGRKIFIIVNFMRTRRFQWNTATQPSASAEHYFFASAPTLRAAQQFLRNWIESVTVFTPSLTFIGKVKRIAEETRAAQRFEKRCAKQAVLNRINTHLKGIADGLEAAIEREAKEIGNGILTYKILQPDNHTPESNVSAQLASDAHAVIIADDIRKVPAFAQLTAKCAAIGVKLELVEQWSNIAWNPYLGGNAAFVWQITISGW